MTDGETLSAALTSAKTAFDLLKVLRDSGSAFKTAEFQLKFADAISALSEVRVQLADVQERRMRALSSSRRRWKTRPPW